MVFFLSNNKVICATTCVSDAIKIFFLKKSRRLLSVKGHRVESELNTNDYVSKEVKQAFRVIISIELSWLDKCTQLKNDDIVETKMVNFFVEERIEGSRHHFAYYFKVIKRQSGCVSRLPEDCLYHLDCKKIKLGY